VADYRCWSCGRIFNLWTGTPFQGTHLSPLKLERLLQLSRRGVSSSEISRRLDCDRGSLARFRHKLERELRQVLGPLPKKRPRHTNPKRQRVRLPR
jgi:transposase-like protein